MDEVLARLWELCQDDAPDAARATEAQHLWKTVETLVAAQKPTELRVHDAAFSKLLVCACSVLQAPDMWRKPAAGRGVVELASRVLAKLGCRGADEREMILRKGGITLLVQMLQSDNALSAGELAAVLHTFQTLAFDIKHRLELMACGALTAALEAMRRSPSDLNVQLCGCKFLQYMAYEESTKELMIHNHGIATILGALESFASDEQLASSASDVLYFLSLDLEAALAQHETQFVATTEAILERVLSLMHCHTKVQQIQTHGVATLLTFAGPHASARRYLSSLSNSSLLWRVCIGAVESNDDAAADTIDLLEVILKTTDCYDQLHAAAIESTYAHCDDTQTTRLGYLTMLVSRLESMRQGHQWVSKTRAIAFLIDRVQSTVDRIREHLATINSSREQSLREQDRLVALREVSDTGRVCPQLYQGEPATRPVRREIDDSDRLLDYGESSPKESRLAFGYFDQYVHDTGGEAGNINHGEEETPTDARPLRRHGASNSGENRIDCSHSCNWQQEYEKARRKKKELEGEYHVLQQSYQLVVRRAQEQSKLLNIQNGRIQHHMEVHHQVIERVKSLEKALADAQRRHQVERELRLAEVAQSEKISLSLFEAMKEISTLNRQNSTTTRELHEKEKLRVDFQHKASAVRLQQQKLEYERDDAVTQMLYMRNEQFELSKQLEETRQEANEALLMREEDVDAPKLSAFSEMLCRYPSARLKKVSSYTLTTKRVVAEASERQLRHLQKRKSMFAGSINRAVRPVDASMMRKSSMYGSKALSDRRPTPSTNMMAMNGEFVDEDSEEDMMEPPKENDNDTGLGSLAPPPQRGLDKFEIERALRAVYDGFDKPSDGDSVHLATIRRFFGDCGIVQPPLVSGDVDTILARVLNQAQANRKRVMVRKDLTVSTFPGGIGNASSAKKATEAKRFRFFDEESFFEAVTLLVMRRFPRFEAKKALEVFITEYIHPMQRQQQQQQQLLMHRRSTSGSASGLLTMAGPVRSGSMSGSGTSGNSSPTAACIGILKTVLNGLALHIGQNDASTTQQDPHFHSKRQNSTNTILLASGQHERKPKREDVVYSMLEMHAVLAREYRPLATICEFYSAMHHTPRDHMLKDEAVMPLTFELLLTFAMDFEIIPSFMDRLSLKRLHSEVSGYLKSYMALHKKMPPPHAIDTEMLKKVAFSMVLARLAMELFSTKREYETPEKQITALLQWLDNSVGRDKIQRKAMLPIVIKFSRKLYALRTY